jgi:hypothetical protein
MNLLNLPHLLKTIAFGLSFLLLSCQHTTDDNDEITTFEIEDPYRKYFPVLQGQPLSMFFKVTNTGDYPLYIYDVLPSCGCTTVKHPRAIAPGTEANIELEFNSNKNIGHVGVYTTIVTNSKEKFHVFFFETNVVPDALYIKDYEQIYSEAMKDEKGFMQEFVDGQANQKGYIVDSTETRRFR